MPRVRAIGLGRLLLLFAVAAGGYWYGQYRAASRAALTRPDEHLADGRTVITAIEQLARLETVSFHMERLIDLKHRQRRLFGLVEADDAILLAAAGDVVAGVDLAGLGIDAITVEAEARRVTLTLPAPRILSTRLDNSRTRVYRRETELLAHRGEHLESRARQVAEQTIKRAALDAGILATARFSAESALRALLFGLGFRNVEIDFHNPRQSPE